MTTELHDQPHTNATTIRELAEQIAAAGAQNTDPKGTLEDLGAAVTSIATTAEAIIAAFHPDVVPVDPLDDEEAAMFHDTISYLTRAANGLQGLASWI